MTDKPERCAPDALFNPIRGSKVGAVRVTYDDLKMAKCAF